MWLRFQTVLTLDVQSLAVCFLIRDRPIGRAIATKGQQAYHERYLNSQSWCRSNWKSPGRWNQPRRIQSSIRENICEYVTRYPWIFDEAWDDSCPPAALLSRFGPCGLFLVPEVKILTKSSPISEGRRDRRKFDKGPSRHPAKHVPGRVPELEKAFGAVYQEWRGVLWRRQVWLSCK